MWTQSAGIRFNSADTGGTFFFQRTSVRNAHSPFAGRFFASPRRTTTAPAMLPMMYWLKAYAAALVSLDQRACAREQIRDADRLLHELLFPMSFPWSHPNEPVYKVMPYDLDEMTPILRAGCTTPDYSAHGEFGHLRSSQVPRHTQVAARRSDDPGVVELTSFFKPSKAQRHLMCTPRRFDPFQEDPRLPGELSLRMYKEVQERKRKRETMEMANKKTTQVSFRLGSTSSRSSIFSDVLTDPESELLLLPAKFPRTLQDAMRISGPDVVERALALGSYNARPVPPQAIAYNDTSSKNRLFVGRTRLIWSEKLDHVSNSQRAPYRSLLTGDRIEGSAWKRPLQVKVAIRLNGALLSSKRSTAKRRALELDAALSNEEPFSYSGRTVNDAVDSVCRVAGAGTDSDAGTGDHSQCSLNNERLLAEASRQLLRRDKSTASRLLHRIRQELAIQVQSTISLTNPVVGAPVVGDDLLVFVPPCIDCVPTEDGLLSVVCTKPGRINWATMSSDETRQRASILILRELASQLSCCSICWRHDSSTENDGSSVTCDTCTTRVHAACLPPKQGDAPWVCRACQTDKTVAESKCTFCNHSGGELVQEENGAWVHEICRTWCIECSKADDSGASVDAGPGHPSCSNDFESPTQLETLRRAQAADPSIKPMAASGDNDALRCHLCANSSHAVVRCAAESCSLQFHPMCAVIASMVSIDACAACARAFRNCIVELYLLIVYSRFHCCFLFGQAANVHYHQELWQGDAKERDAFLCSQYRLSMLHTSFCGGDSVTGGNSTTLPVAFCGYHNPGRQEDFYGLYPGGFSVESGIMRIPSDRTR